MTKSTPAGAEGKSYRMAGTRIGRKAIQVHVDTEVWKALKVMAMDKEKSLQDLVADLLGEAVAKPTKRTKG